MNEKDMFKAAFRKCEGLLERKKIVQQMSTLKNKCRTFIKNHGFVTGFWIYSQVWSYRLLIYSFCSCGILIDIMRASLEGAYTFGTLLVHLEVLMVEICSRKSVDFRCDQFMWLSYFLSPTYLLFISINWIILFQLEWLF